MKILGIDHGDARVGLAISDALGWTAQPVGTVSEHDRDRQLLAVTEKIRELKAEKVVVGLPKNMNGSIGERGEIAKEFAAQLETAAGVPVVLWDERLSSSAAHRTLAEGNVSGKKRKGKVDTLAAVFILQGYLDSLN